MQGRAGRQEHEGTNERRRTGTCITGGTVEIDGEGRYLLLVDDVKRYFGTIVERHQRESVDDARQELRPEVALPEMQHLR